MLRANELSTYNKSKSLTPFDEYLISLGGKSFINTFTPSPDTNRSVPTFLCGVPSYLNNLYKKGSSINFLELPTFLDELLNFGYTIRLLPYPTREGLFPQRFRNKKFMITGDTLIHNLEKINFLEENTLVFIDLPDAHIFVNDNFSHETSVKKYLSFLPKMLGKVDESLGFDRFDLLAIFSDHGHHTLFEPLKFNRNDLLDFRRTKILMHLKSKDEDEFTTHDELHSISDFFGTILKVAGIDHPVSNQFGNSLLIPGHSRRFVIFEDMYEWYLGISQTPEIWKCITNDGTYQINCQQEEEMTGNWQEAKEYLYQEHPKIDSIIREYIYFNSLTSRPNLNTHRFHSDGSARIVDNNLKILVKIYSRLNNPFKKVLKKIIRVFNLK
jgi:hypothetical protein